MLQRLKSSYKGTILNKGRVLAGFVVLLVLAGCASREPVNTAMSEPSLAVFECAQTSVSFYYLSPDDARLYLPDGPVELQQTRSASGARFVGEDIEFWDRGNRALLTLPGQATTECQVNDDRAPRDTLGRYPVNFRALGNEPGWLLELSDVEARLLTDYGQVRTVTPLPDAKAVGPGVSYDITADVTELIIHLEPAPCQDSMSGEDFDWTAVVTLDGQAFHGCGRALTKTWP